MSEVYEALVRQVGHALGLRYQHAMTLEEEARAVVNIVLNEAADHLDHQANMAGALRSRGSAGVYYLMAAKDLRQLIREGGEDA